MTRLTYLVLIRIIWLHALPTSVTVVRQRLRKKMSLDNVMYELQHEGAEMKLNHVEETSDRSQPAIEPGDTRRLIHGCR